MKVQRFFKSIIVLLLLNVSSYVQIPIYAAADESPFVIRDKYYLEEYLSYDVTELTLPNNVLFIDPGCFRDHSELKSVTLSNRCRTIGDYAFINCTSLESIYIPETIMSIGMGAFLNCTALPDNPLIPAEAWGTECNVDLHLDPQLYDVVNGTYLLHYLGTDIEELQIPDGITAISPGCFAYHNELKTVEMPNSVTYTGEYLFRSCHNLQEATVSASLTEMSRGMFLDCIGLRSATVPGNSLQTVGINCFADCTALEELHLPDTIQHFERDAMTYSKYVEVSATDYGTLLDGKYLLDFANENENYAVTLPDGTCQINQNALKDHKELIALKLPDSMRTLDTLCMQGCTELMDLQLNDGLLTIGENVFYECLSLKSLVIPASVTKIGEQAHCALKDIYGTPGTAAEEYARAHNLTFHDAAKLALSGKDNTIVYGADTWSIRNGAVDFGDTYYLTDTARAELLRHMTSGQEWLNEPFKGSCFGLTVTTILAKAGVLPASRIQPGAATLSDITPEDSVLSVINFYHFTQQTKELLGLATERKTDAQIMYRTIEAAKNVKQGGLPFLISLSFSIGGHAYVGYGQEDGDWAFNDRNYDGRILVWDPNFPTVPNENTYIYYNSATLEYCIPYYKSYVNTGDIGSIARICADAELLNLYPYPFGNAAIAGDVNCDGEVDLKDAVVLAKVIGGVGEISLTAEAFANADLNSDMQILAGDLMMLLRALVA